MEKTPAQRYSELCNIMQSIGERYKAIHPAGWFHTHAKPGGAADQLITLSKVARHKQNATELDCVKLLEKLSEFRFNEKIFPKDGNLTSTIDLAIKTTIESFGYNKKLNQVTTTRQGLILHEARNYAEMFSPHLKRNEKAAISERSIKMMLAILPKTSTHVQTSALQKMQAAISAGEKPTVTINKNNKSLTPAHILAKSWRKDGAPGSPKITPPGSPANSSLASSRSSSAASTPATSPPPSPLSTSFKRKS